MKEYLANYIQGGKNLGVRKCLTSLSGYVNISEVRFYRSSKALTYIKQGGIK